MNSVIDLRLLIINYTIQNFLVNHASYCMDNRQPYFNIYIIV